MAGCLRRMMPAPVQSLNTHLGVPMWVVDGHEITDYTLRFQRLYSQHPCGCWSAITGSENSIKA